MAQKESKNSIFATQSLRSPTRTERRRFVKDSSLGAVDSRHHNQRQRPTPEILRDCNSPYNRYHIHSLRRSNAFAWLPRPPELRKHSSVWRWRDKASQTVFDISRRTVPTCTNTHSYPCRNAYLILPQR